MASRVVGAPQITTSRGTTRILLEGAVVYSDPRQERRRENKRREEKGAHADDANTFNVVYVNDVARAAMSGGRATKFPTGSIIVSEKLSKPDDAPPEFLAVMFKRAPGFNPAAGDWEFLVVNGALTEVRERHKNGSCLKCHTSQREGDFVFPLTAPK